MIFAARVLRHVLVVLPHAAICTESTEGYFPLHRSRRSLLSWLELSAAAQTRSEWLPGGCGVVVGGLYAARGCGAG